MQIKSSTWVEVRSKEEILRTLDQNGRLDELPFMPQMLQYCGQRFPIYKSAHKTCDTVSGNYAGRRLRDGVHLDLRCDGQAYGGCQAGCLLFWKTAWLKPVDGPIEGIASPPESAPAAAPPRHAGCSEQDVWRATKRLDADGETQYACQATQLLDYTTPLRWWDLRQYVEAYASGNWTLPGIVRGLWYLFYYYATLAFSERWGRPARWLYDRFQAATGGIPFPRRKGKIANGQLTPRRDLKLAPGELVRIRSYDEILGTLSTNLQNRGLQFDAELVPFCGKVFPVKTRVERFIDEKTGRMRWMKTPAVILDGVTCQAFYCGRRMFCPRAIHLWWREIWLERVDDRSVRPGVVSQPRETARGKDLVA